MTLIPQLNPNPDAPTASGVLNRMAYTNTRWRECVIWCACEGGRVREVTAWVYGAFAVHPTLDDDRCHTITHIPTGKRALHVYGDDRVGMCEYIVESLTAVGDWNTRSVGKLKRLKEAM